MTDSPRRRGRMTHMTSALLDKIVEADEHGLGATEEVVEQALHDEYNAALLDAVEVIRHCTRSSVAQNIIERMAMLPKAKRPQ